jgi:predicted extracellular nuclease
MKIATFNVLNLALPGFKCYPNSEPLSAADFEAKTSWIASQLDRMNADIIGFQEVWQEEALRHAFNKTARYKSLKLLAAPLAGAGNTLPRLAIASRYAPLSPPESLAAFPREVAVTLPGGGTHSAFSRPLIRARFNVGGLALTCFVTHLKSKRPEYLDGEDGDNPRHRALANLRSLIMRGAEATAMRLAVIDAAAGRDSAVAVMGDLNDSLFSVTTQMVAATSWRRFDKPLRDAMLFDAYDLQTERRPRRDLAYTHVHDGNPETLDHILLSEEFLEDSKNARGRVVRVEYYNDHLNDREGRLADVYSDHGQVVAEIVIEPAPQPAQTQ